MLVDNGTMGGDPAPGQRKQLVVKYTYGSKDDTRTQTINEGNRLFIQNE